VTGSRSSANTATASAEPTGPQCGTITQLMRLSKTVHRATPESALGMTFRQSWVLTVLIEHGGSRSQNELGKQLLVDANNLVLLLNELEDAGLIERRRDPDDRRRHIVVITDRGRAAYERGLRAQEALEDKVLAALDADERAQLRALLVKALNG
jgi:DNA-binding MarR family transcriptional regulator